MDFVLVSGKKWENVNLSVLVKIIVREGLGVVDLSVSVSLNDILVQTHGVTFNNGSFYEDTNFDKLATKNQYTGFY